MGERSGLSRRGVLGAGAVVAGAAAGAGFGTAAYGDAEMPPPWWRIASVSTVDGTVPDKDLILHNGRFAPSTTQQHGRRGGHPEGPDRRHRAQPRPGGRTLCRANAPRHRPARARRDPRHDRGARALREPGHPARLPRRHREGPQHRGDPGAARAARRAARGTGRPVRHRDGRLAPQHVRRAPAAHAGRTRRRGPRSRGTALPELHRSGRRPTASARRSSSRPRCRPWSAPNGSIAGGANAEAALYNLRILQTARTRSAARSTRWPTRPASASPACWTRSASRSSGRPRPTQALSNFDHYRMYDSWRALHAQGRTFIRLADQLPAQPERHQPARADPAAAQPVPALRRRPHDDRRDRRVGRARRRRRPGLAQGPAAHRRRPVAQQQPGAEPGRARGRDRRLRGDGRPVRHQGPALAHRPRTGRHAPRFSTGCRRSAGPCSAARSATCPAPARRPAPRSAPSSITASRPASTSTACTSRR